MPKVKHTDRKEPKRLEVAIKKLRCFRCGYPFTKSYNYRRHLCNAQGVNEHGEPSSTSDCERYGRFARKEEQKQSQSARSSYDCSYGAATVESTSKEQHSTGINTRLKQACQKMDRQSSYPEPARGPERPLSPEIVAVVRQQSKVRPRAASARRPKPALKKKEPEVAAATARKPT